MKIIADENIPFAQALFSQLGEVVLKPGRDLKHDDLIGAQVLLTRSVTKVNQALIGQHAIDFVGTCTIGTDHLDLAWLKQRGITYASAPGCNANGVVQYVLCALAQLGKLSANQKVAIIGCGNVGGRVYRALKAVGMHCVCIDPHLSREQIPDLAAFEAIYDCDIICMHTPRIVDGEYPTEGLLGLSDFERLKPGAVLLNAGRGECINNPELLSYLQGNDDLHVVLDVWANEPHMMPALYGNVLIGSPHIAGYSFEGRVNGSTMIFTSLATHLGYEKAWIDQQLDALRAEYFGPVQDLQAGSLSELVLSTYEIQRDHQSLGEVLGDLPASFDVMRKQYFKRREFSHYRVDKPTRERLGDALVSALNFQ